MTLATELLKDANEKRKRWKAAFLVMSILFAASWVIKK